MACRFTSLKIVGHALLAWAILCGPASLWSQNNAVPPGLPVIPAPASWNVGNGSAVLRGTLNLKAPAALEREAQLLRSWWSRCSLPAPRTALQQPEEWSAQLSVDVSLPAEGYKLRVQSGKIMLEGGSDAGVFYGLQTLFQCAVEDTAAAVYRLPKLEVEDRPAFAYRGMHLDVSRHFFGVEFLKKHLDALARAKMNTFHWHLTDDQGWRIEIKKYPLLTQVGGWRSGSQQGPYSLQYFDTLRYGGFYTQEEIREVVAYAAERHIRVIPELEMPGHALAALAAYPELSCRQKPLEVARGWGVFDDVFCAGNDSTFGFLENVLAEVFALFPGEYVHIGGDECPKTRWNECARCTARMRAEGLKDAHELQSYFIQRMERFANNRGKKIIGWDEILEGGLAPNATVMSWRGEEGGKAAAKSGHNAIMTPGKPCYFDHYQAKVDGEPHAIGGYNPVEAVYLYSVVPDGLSPEEQKRILGSQGNVWTEYMLTPDHVEYMMHPRMEALAEVLWTGPRKPEHLPDFQRRMRLYARDMERSGYRVAPHFLNSK